MSSRSKVDAPKACSPGKSKRKLNRSKMVLDLREATKTSLSRPIAGGQLNPIRQKELPVRTTAEYQKRRKSFHDHERTVVFVPSGKNRRTTTYTSRTSSSDAQEHVISPNLMRKIKRTFNNRPSASKNLQCPHAPQNTSSYLMDQYNRRCKKHRQEEPDVEALSSCLEGIDTFGSFVRPTATPVSG